MPEEALALTTVEIVISEQWSWKVAWFLKEQYCPARNHTALHDHVLLVTFSTVFKPFLMKRRKVFLFFPSFGRRNKTCAKNPQTVTQKVVHLSAAAVFNSLDIQKIEFIVNDEKVEAFFVLIIIRDQKSPFRKKKYCQGKESQKRRSLTRHYVKSLTVSCTMYAEAAWDWRITFSISKEAENGLQKPEPPFFLGRRPRGGGQNGLHGRIGS